MRSLKQLSLNSTRNCRICGRQISSYNYIGQCFYHEELIDVPETINRYHPIPGSVEGNGTKCWGEIMEAIESGRI